MDTEPMIHLAKIVINISLMIFFTSLFFRLMIYMLNRAYYVEVSDSNCKDTKTTEFESNIELLEKYYKDDLSYIKQTIKEGKHPHTNIIKENFDNLIKLINKKELSLNSTVDKNKINILTNDIRSVITKYVELIDNLNNNLVENELSDMKNLNNEILTTIENFKANKIDIENFVHNHNISEKIDDNFVSKIKEKINNKSFINYFEIDGVQYQYQYDYLKKLLNNDKVPYYNSIIEMLYVILEYTEQLEKKEQFVQKSLRLAIEKGIKTTISNYIELLTVLDRISELPVDNDIKEYEQLLDEIVKDVKNKNAMF